MEQKKIEEMNVVELKALAYDQLALLEQTQKNIQVINQMISKKTQENKPANKKDELKTINGTPEGV
jgi:hypothetical protein